MRIRTQAFFGKGDWREGKGSGNVTNILRGPSSREECADSLSLPFCLTLTQGGSADCGASVATLRQEGVCLAKFISAFRSAQLGSVHKVNMQNFGIF